MTLIFNLKKANGGKRGRWSKKFPRKKIFTRRGEKAANWFRNNWIDDSYTYLRGNIHKFLLANIGRPVDKVFSEFLKRCDKTAHKYNLKYKFYDYFEEKSEIDYHGGFYLTNGIVNYKKPTKRPKGKPYILIEDRNRAALPVLGPICRECERLQTPQFLGVFKVMSNGEITDKRVYVITKEAFEYNFKCKPVKIIGVGNGIRKDTITLDQVKQRTYYNVVDSWYGISFKPDFWFVIKEKL